VTHSTKTLHRTTHYSWKLNNISKGCQLCVRGRKLVFVVTGVCADHCYFCPLSDQKKNKDIVWANEWKDAKIKDVLKEAALTEAKGAGITGGDPLIRLNRTIKYIKLFKKRFGKKFHIHLYTPLTLVTKDRLEKLHAAGLDEIRFHPFVDKPHDWNKIDLAFGVQGNKFNWDVGIEIPVIPGKYQQTLDMIKYFEPKIKFLNLNELEISDANASKLLQFGFKPKDSLSYGVKDSGTTALKIMKVLSKKHGKLKVHYCTAQLKDRAQLANRLKIRARNVAQSFDIITPEATLIRGVFYINSLSPALSSYRRLLEEVKADKKRFKNIKSTLLAAKRLIAKNFNIGKDSILFDENKLRLLTSAEIADKLKNSVHELGLVAAIVEEYPTWDAMEVDVNILT